MPLLITAELVVHKRMLPITKQFLSRQLIPDHALEQFNAANEWGIQAHPTGYSDYPGLFVAAGGIHASPSQRCDYAS